MNEDIEEYWECPRCENEYLTVLDSSRTEKTVSCCSCGKEFKIEYGGEIESIEFLRDYDPNE